MHPYRKAAHRNDPKWLRGVEKFVEKHSADDIDAVVRNYGGDRELNAKAAYDLDEEKK